MKNYNVIPFVTKNIDAEGIDYENIQAESFCSTDTIVTFVYDGTFNKDELSTKCYLNCIEATLLIKDNRTGEYSTGSIIIESNTIIKNINMSHLINIYTMRFKDIAIACRRPDDVTIELYNMTDNSIAYAYAVS